MPLLNVDDAIPRQLWALVRLLTSTAQPLTAESARVLLQPPTLLSDGKQDKTFERALTTLRQLGFVISSGEDALILNESAQGITVDDFDGFRRALREAVLDSDQNVDLAEQPTAGPKDLTSVLAAFLTRDPLEPAVTWQDIKSISIAVFDPDATDPTPNDTRWNRFGHWAPALGLAAPPLVPTKGKSPLVPDCTLAVRQVVASLWRKGEVVGAVEFLQAVRDKIPVLPGGTYSKALRLPDPGATTADPALSFAMLRCEYDELLRLQRNADARSFITVADRDQPNRRVTDVVMLEANRG
jgi:hypothetical protein